MSNIVNKSDPFFVYMFFNYPKYHEHSYFRPELKLELNVVVAEQVMPIEAAISSIYASTLKQQPEIQSMSCDHINTILVEKFIGFLRKTAAAARGHVNSYDITLVRHVYDLHLICAQAPDAKVPDISTVVDLFRQTLNVEVLQFGARHVEFKDNPPEELLYGLDILMKNKKYKDGYAQFLGPLVYNATPPTWEQVVDSLDNLARRLLLVPD
jgi:hypothetical protein